MSQSYKRQKSSTTKLPVALQEELGLEVRSIAARGGNSGSNGHSKGERGGRGSWVIGRKEARKAERRERKGSRGGVKESKGSHQPSKFVNAYRERIDAEAPVSVKSFKGKEKERSRPELSLSLLGRQNRLTSKEQRKHVHEEESTPLQRLMMKNGKGDSNHPAKVEGADTKRKRKRLALSAAEQQEEDEIAWLEAHLGSKSGKTERKKSTKGKEKDEEEISGGDDGLDDLLEDLDRFYPGMYDEETDGTLLNSESEGDLSADEGGEGSSDQSSLDIGMSSEESSERDITNEERASSNEEPDSKPVLTTDSTNHSHKVEANGVNGEGKYVPPALRKKMLESQDESKIKLQRQAKGLLNRLGEGNLDVIVTELLDTLYGQYSRADVTDTLTDLIIQTISASNNMVDTFVILQATLVTSLYRLVGIEFGAHFLQTLIEAWNFRYQRLIPTQSSSETITDEEAGREVKNLTSLISHLYNVGLIASPLIFDIIKVLLKHNEAVEANAMSEIDVELLHKVVKTSGQQLRHDDATSLKTIIELASGFSTPNAFHTASSRSRFMLEALENLKNTRVKNKLNPSLEQQSILRMKKYLGGLNRKKIIRTQEPLRVGLKDLQDADKRGKWWLVGAAWAGYEAEAIKPTMKDGKDNVEKEKKEALRDMARKHGMNTTIRQDIFIILISSQDYLDALEKLQSLGFKKEIQRREIIRILLHCIGSEVHYNPYYVVLASRLAIDDISVRFTLQYCLWDYMRELGEKEVGGRSIVEREEADEMDSFELEESSTSSHRLINIARAYGWWFAKGALSLSATKVINFTGLKSKGISFLQQVIIHFCLSFHTNSPALTLRLVSKKSSNTYMIKDTKSSSVKMDESVKKSLESILVKGTLSNATHSQGLLFFLERHLKVDNCIQIANQMGASEETIDYLLLSRNVMKQVLKVGASTSRTSDRIL